MITFFSSVVFFLCFFVVFFLLYINILFPEKSESKEAIKYWENWQLLPSR